MQGSSKSSGGGHGASQASKRVLRELRAKDTVKRETAKAKNDLEAYIISTRDKVGRAHRALFVAFSCTAPSPQPHSGCAVQAPVAAARVMRSGPVSYYPSTAMESIGRHRNCL